MAAVVVAEVAEDEVLEADGADDVGAAVMVLDEPLTDAALFEAEVCSVVGASVFDEDVAAPAVTHWPSLQT